MSSHKIIVYGDMGGGKSHFAATCPKPMLLCFFDGGGKETPYLKRGVPTELKNWKFGDDRIPYRRVMSKKKPDEELIRVEYYRDLIVSDPQAARMFSQRMIEFVDPDTKYSVQDYKTLVIDSSTSLEYFTRKDAQYRTNRRAKDARLWYGATQQTLEELYMGNLPSLPLNVVLVMHINQERDDVLGKLVYNPAAPGKILPKRLTSQWAELYHAYVDVDDEGDKQYYLQTASNKTFHAATQIPAPDPCTNNWKALFEDVEAAA